MKIIATPLAGVHIVELELIGDARGFFARAYCAQDFSSAGLNARWVQANISLTNSKGAVRGLHYQDDPWQESKLVRVVRGAIFDVAVDVSRGSPTYLRWTGVELTSDNRRALYVPEGFAHGFQTLTGDAEVHYLVSQFYHQEAERGLRCDDPALAIAWPLPISQVSAKDAAWPFLGAGERG